MRYTVTEQTVRLVPEPMYASRDGKIRVAIDSRITIRDPEGRVVAEMAAGMSPALAHQFAAVPELLEAAEAVLARMTADCFRMCGSRPGSEICGDVCCPVLADIQRLAAAVAKAEGRDADERNAD